MKLWYIYHIIYLLYIIIYLSIISSRVIFPTKWESLLPLAVLRANGRGPFAPTLPTFAGGFVGPGTKGKSYVLKKRQARDLAGNPVFSQRFLDCHGFFFRIYSKVRSLSGLTKGLHDNNSSHIYSAIYFPLQGDVGKETHVWDHRSEPTVLQTAQRVFGRLINRWVDDIYFTWHHMISLFQKGKSLVLRSKVISNPASKRVRSKFVHLKTSAAGRCKYLVIHVTIFHNSVQKAKFLDILGRCDMAG